MQYLVNLIGKGEHMLVEKKKEGFVDMEVSPKLNEFLETVFMKMPSLSFVAHDYTQYLVKCSKYDDQANLIEDSEWMKFINCVRVYNGTEEVGYVRVNDEVYRSNIKQTIYSIRSDKHRMNNGRSDTKKTKDPKEALKRCLKVFVTSPEAAMVQKCYESISGEANNMKYWSGRALTRVLSESELEIVEYFKRIKDGEQNIPIPKSISDELDKPSTIKDLDTAKLAIVVAEAIENKNGIIVGDVNNKIVVADLANTTYRTIDSSYDLPELYQTKLAVLKIVEERQPVAHVGVKITNRGDDTVWYFLMNGDILTTC
jgi:hypothetical protein